MSQLRVLSYRYYGFDKDDAHRPDRRQRGRSRQPLAEVFAKLYRLRFPIRDGAFASTYGPHPDQSGDVTASFECRNAVAVAVQRRREHAPLVDARVRRGRRPRPAREPVRRLRDDARQDRALVPEAVVAPAGMVTPAVLHAFASVGWGWGGSWVGSTKDYMHFSINGH